MIFGVGALLAPQLVHHVEVQTGSGTGVFYVAVALASSMAVVTLLLPEGATPPGAAAKSDAPRVPTRERSAVIDETGQPPAPPYPQTFEPIIWDEAGDDEIGPSLPVSSGGSGGPSGRRGGPWRLPFQAALLALLFSNVSIELGELTVVRGTRG